MTFMTFYMVDCHRQKWSIAQSSFSGTQQNVTNILPFMLQLLLCVYVYLSCSGKDANQHEQGYFFLAALKTTTYCLSFIFFVTVTQVVTTRGILCGVAIETTNTFSSVCPSGIEIEGLNATYFSGQQQKTMKLLLLETQSTLKILHV